MKNTYFGKLVYNDDAEFEIHDDTGIINITQLLDGIYKSENKLIFVEVMKANSLLFQEDGGVCIKPDEQNVMCHYICGVNLDRIFWDNTDEYVEITIYKRGKTRNYGK